VKNAGHINGLPPTHPGEFLRETLDELGLTQATASTPESDDPSTWGALTPSTRRLNELVGVNPVPRRLTPEEIDLLLKSKQEIQRHCAYFSMKRREA
jgi:hypothetical protein